MATRGAWQLRRLVVNYCDFGGSSAGVREILASGWMSDVKAATPGLETQAEVRRGHHPFVIGEYGEIKPKIPAGADKVDGPKRPEPKRSRSVGLQNLSPAEVIFQLEHLRSEKGHRTGNKVKRHLTSRQSIQGAWAPGAPLPSQGLRGAAETNGR